MVTLSPHGLRDGPWLGTMADRYIGYTSVEAGTSALKASNFKNEKYVSLNNLSKIFQPICIETSNNNNYNNYNYNNYNNNHNNNHNNKPFINKIDINNKHPITFGLITCLGLVGNGLVIYVIVTKERMRTVINLLLLNLAVADLSFVFVIPPSTAYIFAFETWHFGTVACKLMHYLVNVTAYVTVYTLVLVTVVRYLTIVHNLKTSRFRTRPIIVCLICAIWVIACLANSFIFVAYGTFSDLKTPEMISCDLYDGNNGKPMYALFFLLAYLLPLIIIAFLSIGIARQMARNRPTTHAAALRKMRSARRKRQIGRLLIFVVVLFAAFWLPIHIHLLVAYFGKISTSDFYRVLTFLWYCLAYANSCVNPIIYNCASKDFRIAFKETVVCLPIKPTNRVELSNSILVNGDHRSDVHNNVRACGGGRAYKEESIMDEFVEGRKCNAVTKYKQFRRHDFKTFTVEIINNFHILNNNINNSININNININKNSSGSSSNNNISNHNNNNTISIIHKQTININQL
ncbi:hypothetical protein HELRODRAFT_173575 [Helobdella robusta]|uniref:G-protein coupled receptors family 1 profile domain-containing protein n=1 Tax=Helobdella robusta TaxID=6412 RepID=T1F6Z4_HELRO|nr:hypothetical protein HELRODRAFT_173575 [Helobdella robusta]ESO03290.1 hypothetical protein HELRODRAFT_173575 [Helobdella robusta]